jgi:DNA-binding Lrp family transcriptional regulator
MVSEPGMRQIKKPRDINAKVAELVKIVGEVGPDIPEVAKRMGEHKESVRYWFKKLFKQGLVIQPSINFEKIGLTRVVAVADFARDYQSQAEPILVAMSELCYVQSFVKTLPEGHYIIHGTVPREFVSSWMSMMSRLKDLGLFTSLELSTYDWSRNPPMKSEFYDFDGERWDFEWSLPTKVYPGAVEQVSTREKFDETDLEIIKRLQRDANRSLSEIQKEIGTNYKTLSFHYRNHILRRGLLKSYRVNWIGTPYNPENDKGKHRRHTYQPIDVVIRDITPAEKAAVMGMTNSLPFLWWEASGANSYYAQLVFPTDSIAEAMQFLGRALLSVTSKAHWFMVDQTQSVWFRLEPRLLDRQSKRWTFNEAEVLSKFERILPQIKRGF